MRTAIRVLTLAVACLALGGCGALGGSDRSLPPIQYYFVQVFENYDRIVYINPDGAVEVVERTGRGAENLRRSTGKVTAEQNKALLSAFQGWKQLKPTYSTDITSVIRITYNDYTVEAGGGEKTPKQFMAAKAALDNVVRAVVTARPAETRP